MTKKDKVLYHLKNYGPITPRIGIDQYNVFRLADIIFKLRNEGFDIKTEEQESNGSRYAKYVLVTKELKGQVVMNI